MTTEIHASRIFTEPEAAERRAALLPQILDCVQQVKEVDGGYSLKFMADLETMILVMDWLLLERTCNAFLRFKLSIESNAGPSWVDITGPAGTQDFLKTEFALSRWL